MNELNEIQGAQPDDSATHDDAIASEQLASNTIDFASEIEKLSNDELAAALGFETSGIEITQPEDKGGGKPPEEPETVQPESPEETSEPKSTIRRQRLSISGLADTDRDITAAAIALVREGKASSIIEAVQSLAPQTNTATERAPELANGEHPPTNNPANAPQTLIALEARFEQANEEMAEAIREFDQEKQVALNKEIALLNRQILRAEQAEETASKQATSWEYEYQDAVNRMEEKYAELLDDDTNPFGDYLDDKVEAAKARKDPALHDPNFILRFADEIAARMQTAKPAKSPSPLPQRPTIVTGSNVAPSNRSKAQMTTGQIEQFINTASVDVLEKALWG